MLSLPSQPDCFRVAGFERQRELTFVERAFELPRLERLFREPDMLRNLRDRAGYDRRCVRIRPGIGDRCERTLIRSVIGRQSETQSAAHAGEIDA
jgi:hypothetical protein